MIKIKDLLSKINKKLVGIDSISLIKSGVSISKYNKDIDTTKRYELVGLPATRVIMLVEYSGGNKVCFWGEKRETKLICYSKLPKELPLGEYEKVAEKIYKFKENVQKENN